MEAGAGLGGGWVGGGTGAAISWLESRPALLLAQRGSQAAAPSARSPRFISRRMSLSPDWKGMWKNSHSLSSSEQALGGDGSTAGRMAVSGFVS